jgi:hypothetical protein
LQQGSDKQGTLITEVAIIPQVMAVIILAVMALIIVADIMLIIKLKILMEDIKEDKNN